MSKENFLKLADELESGKWEQVKNRYLDGEKVCAMGVAMKMKPSAYEGTLFSWLDYAFRENYKEKQLRIDIVRLNDSGKTFKEITKYIRENV